MLYLLSVGCKEQKHGANLSRLGCALATPSVYLSFDFPRGLMRANTFRLILYPFCSRRESERGDFERPGPGSKRVMDNFQESPVRLSVGDNQSRTIHDRCHEPRQLGSVLADKLGSVSTDKFPSASTEPRDASALSSAVDLHAGTYPGGCHQNCEQRDAQHHNANARQCYRGDAGCARSGRVPKPLTYRRAL